MTWSHLNFKLIHIQIFSHLIYISTIWSVQNHGEFWVLSILIYSSKEWTIKKFFSSEDVSSSSVEWPRTYFFCFEFFSFFWNCSCFRSVRQKKFWMWTKKWPTNEENVSEYTACLVVVWRKNMKRFERSSLLTTFLNSSKLYFKHIFKDNLWSFTYYYQTIIFW